MERDAKKRLIDASDGRRLPRRPPLRRQADAARLARRRSSPASRPPPKAGRCASSCAGRGASDAAEIEALAKRSLDAACTVVSDGLACFRGVTAAGPAAATQPIRTGSGRKTVLAPAFKWVNTALGNIKTAIVGTYRAIRDKHVPRYLAEFEYRFNRRYDLAAMLPRLGWAAVRTPPMPYRLLKLAEAHA